MESLLEAPEEEDHVASVITCLKWIPRSSCMDRPLMYELNAEERAQLAEKQEQNDENDGDMLDQDMLASQLEEMQLNAARFELGENEENSDLGSDAEDHLLKATDEILVTASVEDDQANLEMHAYDTVTGSFYVHHDICLPSYPLCIEFLGIKGSDYQFSSTSSVNFLAVGTFSPDIEIWNLDVLDALEPNCRLLGDGSDEAVLSLAWNEKHPNLLASGSGDCAIRLFDLETQQIARKYADLHTDKVQALSWNPAEHSVLLSGSFDQTVRLLDCREESASTTTRGGLVFSPQAGDLESVTWDVHNPALFGCSTDQGVVQFFDCRMSGSACLFKFQAHNRPCAQLCGNSRVPGLFMTCSGDRTVKLWDLQEDLNRTKPRKKMVKLEPIKEKKMKAGKLFACMFATNVDFEAKFDPFLLATGGSKGTIALWHAGEEDEDNEGEQENAQGDSRMKQVFQSRVLDTPKRW